MLTIHAAAEAIRQGRLSPLELLESCLQGIDRYEAKVQAWVLVDRDGARAVAQERDQELRRGQWRGPLHGIPLGVKDIFDATELSAPDLTHIVETFINGGFERRETGIHHRAEE